MSLRTLISVAAAAILGVACVSTDAFAYRAVYRGGGVRVGASTAAASIGALTCAVVSAWAWAPPPSVQQWQPRTTTAGQRADITLTRPAIRFSA
jgi:hypothetical protein